MLSDLMVIGSGLAGLIAALGHARRGHTVTLLSDARTPGGHFAGLQVDELDFDLGMVLFEQHQPAVPCDDWRNFNPHQRNDWTRFGHKVSAWLNQEATLLRTPTPLCVVEGRAWPDFLIANRLDAFAGQDLGTSGLLPPDHPEHASAKLRPGRYDCLSYADAAASQHGAALQARFIEPFVRKLTDASSDAFLARHHRAAWVPLYYPETLRDAVAGRPVSLAEYPFWTTAEGCVSTWVRQLNKQAAGQAGLSLDPNPLVTLKQTPAGIEATTAAGQRHKAKDAVIALSPERCLSLLGSPAMAPPPAASVALLLASVAADQLPHPLACTMVVDEDMALYRATSPDGLAGLHRPRVRLVAEANPEVLKRQNPGMEPATALRNELARLTGVAQADHLHVHRFMVAQQALTLPTPAALEYSQAVHSVVRQQLPQARLTASLLGYGVSSLNDQIAQALQILEVIAS